MMIVVANTELLGNHQVELVEELAREEYVLGFSSVEEMNSRFDSISAFLRDGPRNKYHKPQKCILNEIIFGEDKPKAT
jgi:UDP-N-acetylglucosamine transferase subunit ALG13